MNRKIFYFSLLSVAVASCGTVNNKQALGDFEYAKKQQVKALDIPQNLNKPKNYTTYQIPKLVNEDGPVGKNVDVRSPSLVLPIAASTRAELNTPDAKVWFDQVIDDVELKTFIIEALTEQLASDDVLLTKLAEADSFESDWYHSEIKGGLWFFKTVKSSESLRFRYKLISKSHGRSVALTVELIDYMKTDENGGSKTIDQIERQRVEMAMLNQIIAQVDYKYRLKQRENRLLRANQKFVSIGENSINEPAYVVEIGVDLLWSNLPLFFDTYGFKVSDLHESDRIYYVDYVEPGFSFWDRIWGDDFPVIELENGKYKFVLGEKDDISTVTIYDAQGKALSKQVLTDIFGVMEPALSFKDSL